MFQLKYIHEYFISGIPEVDELLVNLTIKEKKQERFLKCRMGIIKKMMLDSTFNQIRLLKGFPLSSKRR